MPVVNFHLTEGMFTEAQAKALLTGAAGEYAAVLEAPMARIRAFITPHPPAYFFAGGDVVSENDCHAPFFEFFVLEGRSLEQRQHLIAKFTELLVEHLGVEKSTIRGYCTRVSPDEWGIGGQPASALRQVEIEARQKVVKTSN